MIPLPLVASVCCTRGAAPVSLRGRGSTTPKKGGRRIASRPSAAAHASRRIATRSEASSTRPQARYPRINRPELTLNRLYQPGNEAGRRTSGDDTGPVIQRSCRRLINIRLPTTNLRHRKSGTTPPVLTLKPRAPGVTNKMSSSTRHPNHQTTRCLHTTRHTDQRLASTRHAGQTPNTQNPRRKV